MRELRNLNGAERADVRALAREIVACFIAEEPLPLPMMLANAPTALRAEIERFVVVLAQEIDALSCEREAFLQSFREPR